MTRMPGNVMSGKFSSRSSHAEITPTASTARKIITVVTGRRSAISVWRMVVSSGRRDRALASAAGAGAW